MQRVSKYWVDKKNVILNTNEYWNTFAIENAGHKVLRPHVIGKPLLSFIKDDITRMLIEAFIDGARVANREASRPYRCDSPEKKRYMEMRAIPEGKGIMRIENEVLSEEPLSEPRRFAVRPPGQTFLKRCSVCNKLSDGVQWYEPDHEKVADYFDQNQTAYIAYSVCRDCQDDMKQRLARLGA